MNGLDGRDGRGRTGRTWTDGTDVDGRDGRDGRGRTGRTESFQNYFFWSHSRIVFSQSNERNSLEIRLLFFWTLARRVRNAQKSLVILCFGWAYKRQNPAAYVQLDEISWELRAFRARLARVQMNRICREFRSFGFRTNNSEMAPIK